MCKALLSSVSLVSLVSLIAMGAACGGAPSEAAAPADSALPADPVAQAPTPVESAAPAAAPPKKVEPAFVLKDAGFASPESVLYDPAGDVYLVSNINGFPSGVDNNGFISKVSPEGKVLELKWIAGGDKGVKLDAPKGMAIAGDTLYVADITVVRMFDLKTGKAKGDVKFQGATFLNDLFAGSDGKVYATDTGIKVLNEKGPEPTKTDSVWVIEKGKAKSLIKSEELGRPNGIIVVNNAVWVVSIGNGEIYRIDDKGKRADVQKPPKGRLDGIVAVGDDVLVSSWDGSAIYRGKPGGTFEPVVTDIKAPADIGFDTKRNRVLVPQLTENTVLAYDVK
jgi:sugar lactone lactonase YvrE